MHLIKKFTLVFIFYFALHQLSTAQERFHEQLFDSIDVQTFTYIVKNDENLDLDVYSPFWDTELNRPVLLYVHGGGFSGGTRDGLDIAEFWKYFDEIVEFCNDFVLEKNGQNRHTIVPGNANACDYQQFDFCSQ